MEEWREIEGMNGNYQVSNYGRVRSVDRTFYDKRGYKRRFTGKIIKPQNTGKGYQQVHISGRAMYVHRLVATAFLEKLEGCDVVNHKDFDPANNCAENLEWTTIKGNYDYSEKAGRYIRTPQWIKKQTEMQRLAVARPVFGISITDGTRIEYSVIEHSKYDGFAPTHIGECCKGHRKSHKGYYWRYASEKQENTA